jgi:hypothetical protein
LLPRTLRVTREAAKEAERLLKEATKEAEAARKEAAKELEAARKQVRGCVLVHGIESVSGLPGYSDKVLESVYFSRYFSEPACLAVCKWGS